MKKILTTLIVVAVLFSAVPLAKAGNPPVNTNNPFPAGYNLSVVKVNNPYMAGFDSYWPTYTRPAPFVVQDGNNVWVFAEKDKNKGNDVVSSYEIDKINMQTGVVEDSIPIQGDLRYWTSILQDDYNYYIISAVYKKDNNGDEKAIKSILYAFSKKTKHIVWKQEFLDVDLVPWIACSSVFNNKLILRIGKEIIWLDYNGNRSNLVDNKDGKIGGVLAYNSKKNALVFSSIGNAKYIYEVNIADKKITNVPLIVKGNILSADKILWRNTFNIKSDIAKTPALAYVNEENVYPYTVLAYLSYDEKNDEYILKEFKKLNPTPLENAQFQDLDSPWFYDIRPLGSGRYLYYDLPRIPYHLTSMYAILYNKDFSKKIWTIRVGKTNVKVNGKTVTYIPINTFRIYVMPEYGKTLIYADKNKIVFADPD
ncbi:MAG: hypothetical protein J7L03_00785, partial [Caldisericaceae bacterium]|nr:hypothetical protein [Caldisericaceae bacterium]